jgi:hypothetical protein
MHEAAISSSERLDALAFPPRTRIALFCSHPFVDQNATLTALKARLSRDADLEVFVRAPGIGLDASLPPEAHFLPARIVPPTVAPGQSVRDLIRWLVRGEWFSSALVRTRRYDVIVAADAMAAAAALPVVRRAQSRLVYLSFEIMSRAGIQSKADAWLREQEAEAIAAANLVVVQDEGREALLRRENPRLNAPVHHLPVSPPGPAHSDRDPALRRRFNVPDDATVVLHTGSITEWTCAEELVNSVERWPKNLHLVLHTPRRPTGSFARLLARCSNPRVHLSCSALTEREVNLLVRGADIGLCLYRPNYSHPLLGANIEKIGLSSGKLSLYAQAGLPVVSVDVPSIGYYTTRYRFGFDVPDFVRLPDAIATIMQDWKVFSDGAVRFYCDFLDFDLHWPELRRAVVDLVKR